MDLYTPYNINYTYIFLAFSFLWLNASLILHSKYFILDKFIKNKALTFSIRVLIVLLISFIIDYATALKPIYAYSNWQVYVIFFTTIFLLCMPGLIFTIIKKYL